MVHLYVPAAELGGEELEVSGASYRHLFRARRLGVGDRLRLVDGCGHARWAEVASVDRRTAQLVLLEAAPVVDPSATVEVAVAVIRPERAAWVAEKATEVGVSAVHWFGCERSPRCYGSGQIDRFRRVAISALEQCGWATLPEIDAIGWHQLLGLVERRQVLVLDPGGDPKPFRPTDLRGSRWLVVVGPEGGLTAKEQTALVELGAHRWRLGASILRTETAVVAACSLLLCHVG